LKLDRAELIRLIEGRPTDGFLKSSTISDWVSVGGGSVIVFSIVITIGLRANAIILAGRTNSFGLFFLFLAFGVVLIGFGAWNLTRRKWYDRMMEKYGGEIRAGDLVEALHFTNRWRSGMAIAEQLYLPEKDFGFGMVWLACQCGNGRFAECDRVLTGMVGGQEVLKLMRRAERRVKGAGSLFGLWYLPYLLFGRLGKPLSEIIWKDPAVAAANRWIIEVIGLTIFGLAAASIIYRSWRLGPEEWECRPYLDQLPGDDLKVLVGWGRLGRVAKAVLEARRG
jgi:hypothetical protein